MSRNTGGTRRIDLSSDAAKERIATALLLLKDYLTQGEFDYDETLITVSFAEALGVLPQLNRVMARLPPMRIEPRYPQDAV